MHTPQSSNIDETRDRYGTLDDESKARFLASFAFHLTLVARGAYPEANEDCVPALGSLKEINELLHRVTQQLFSLLSPTETGYPDSIFWQIVGRSDMSRIYEKRVIWAVLKSWEGLDRDSQAREYSSE